jgi:RNA polymerase subunit RPABC4/transcription elongation factor Spt4
MEEILSWSVVSELVPELAPTTRIQLQGLFGAFTWRSDFWLLCCGVFCFFWIVALIWVIKDVNARTDSLGFQFLSILFILLLTPVFGLPLYMACRPQGWKWDKTLWRQILLAKLQECENCHSTVPIEHDCCVSCGHVLKVACRECWEVYARGYAYCPFCGAPHLDE